MLPPSLSLRAFATPQGNSVAFEAARWEDDCR
jgi:hypothetical protein